MKASVEHRVPLSGRARDIIARLPRIDAMAYVFPGARQAGRFPAWPCWNFCAAYGRTHCSRLSIDLPGLGCEETDFPSEVVEMALAHTIES